MAYLYEPPHRMNRVVLAGRSLTYSFEVTYTVWKDVDGVWHSMETPPAETLSAASVALAGRPQIISDSLAAELIAAGVGTCYPIEA